MQSYPGKYKNNCIDIMHEGEKKFCFDICLDYLYLVKKEC
jgi:hypothetical protein